LAYKIPNNTEFVLPSSLYMIQKSCSVSKEGASPNETSTMENEEFFFENMDGSEVEDVLSDPSLVQNTVILTSTLKRL